MKNLKIYLLVLLSLFGACNSLLMAENHAMEAKKVILLVAFGTSVPEANVAYQNIDDEFRKAFPNQEIRWAYTSKMIRTKLKKSGIHFDSPAEALAKLGEQGFTHVYVQSLHIIPGDEYHWLLTTASRFNNMPKGLKVTVASSPLLVTHNDMLLASKAIIENLPAERKASEAVVFMGHGSHHGSNIYYSGLQYYLWQHDKYIYVGTVEGAPELEDVIGHLEKNKIKKVWLMPLMAVAGDHAKNDMAGSEEDSWKSVLENKGYQVHVVLKGMAEYDNVVDIWIKHLLEKYDI